jgi:hypothetical protein
MHNGITKWEYLRMVVDMAATFSNRTLVDNINDKTFTKKDGMWLDAVLPQMGAYGWELVSIVKYSNDYRYLWVFKRPWPFVPLK